MEDLRIQKKAVQEQLEAAEKKAYQGRFLAAKAEAFMQLYEERLQKLVPLEWFF